MKGLNVYEAPQVEIIEVEVEKGFATSGQLSGTSTESLDDQNGANVW